MARDGRTHGIEEKHVEHGNGARLGRSLDGESAPGLLTRLIDDVAALFRNELALARAETMNAAHQAKSGIGAVATGGAVLLAGLLALVAAAILALAQVVEPWLAALIVGVVVAVIGYAMVSAGRKRLEPANFSMERTQESLRRDRDTLKGSLGGRTQ